MSDSGDEKAEYLDKYNQMLNDKKTYKKLKRELTNRYKE